MSNKVAVVTGANKGIGYAIVEKLCRQFDGTIYLTSRNEDLGKAAVAEIKKQGFNPIYHQLDIGDESSIIRFADYLRRTHSGLDCLINNAGIAYKVKDTTAFAVQAEETIRVNYFGTMNVCKLFNPLLRPHSRVVNVSSRAGLYSIINKPELREKFSLEHAAKLDEIDSLMRTFVEAAKANEHSALGFPNSAYGVSKLGITCATFALQRLYDEDIRPDLVVNACCPGYVKTDMSSHMGVLTPEQGADTPVYLALLPPSVRSPRGNFVCERKVVDWI